MSIEPIGNNDNRLALDQLCAEIVQRRDDRAVRDSVNSPRRVCRASDIDKCARRMALDILYWEKRPAFEVHTIHRLNRGKEIESLIVLPELQRLGFTVVGGQMAADIKARNGDGVICTLHIDGMIERNGHRFVFDCKSMNPNLYAKMKTAEDLLDGKWTYKYLWQLLLYMWAHSLECGFFLIDDCLGHWRCIPVYLWDHADRCEEALTRCAEVMAAVIPGARLPDFIDNPAHCRECWAYAAGVCTPPLDFSGEGIKVLADTKLIEALDRMAELEEVGEEYARLERDVKDRMKARDGDGDYLAGKWIVHRQSRSTTRYDVPTAVKSQYATKGASVYVTWERLPD